MHYLAEILVVTPLVIALWLDVSSLAVETKRAYAKALAVRRNNALFVAL